MLVKIYRRKPPENSPQFAVVAHDSAWGDERGGERHATWSLVSEADLDRPAKDLPFNADEAKAAILNGGLYTYIHQTLPTPVAVKEAEAIHAFMLTVTLPLLKEAGEGMAVLGTGTLFRQDDRYFVVTADHVLRANAKDPTSAFIDLTEVAFPTRPKDASLFTLGKYTLWHSKPVHADVVVLELHSQETISKLKAGWGFLPFSQAGRFEDHDRFIISGFLEETAYLTGGVLRQSMINLTTDLLHFTPEVKDPTPSDRFLYLERDGVQFDGSEREIGSLCGVSGGPIWGFSMPAAGFWDPSRALQVVAVQSAEMERRWSRVMDWSAVRTILQRIDPPVTGV